MGTEQITAGKSRLRQQIKELEKQVAELRNDPLRFKIQRLEAENKKLKEERDQLDSRVTLLSRDMDRSVSELRAEVERLQIAISNREVERASAIGHVQALAALYGLEGFK